MERIVTVLVAIVGVAMVAVLVSKQANTSGVIDSSGNALSGFLATALSPVTGGAAGGAPGLLGAGGLGTLRQF